MISDGTREGEPLVKRSSFAKIGAIMLAVVVGLGLMGVGVSYWSDTVNISATVETGDWGVQLTWCGNCSHLAISCDVVASDTLEVTVTDAEAGDYSCDFDIENTGDIPVKIQSIDVSTLPGGVVVGTTDVVAGTQIDPGPPETGTVNIHLNNAIAGSFGFTVTFEVVPWN